MNRPDDDDAEGERRFTLPINPDPVTARLRAERKKAPVALTDNNETVDRPDEEMVKVRMTKELFQMMVTRDAMGRRLHVELGEPDAEGFYEPTLTTDSDDDLLRLYRPAADLLAKFPGVRAHRTDLILWDHARKQLLNIK